MLFFVGLDDVYNAHHVDSCCISVNRLRRRRSPFQVGKWIMDSGAFTTLARHGGYQDEPDVYAAEIRRWSKNGELLAAVSQDYMCERFMLERTGLTVDDHQRMTIERYDRLHNYDLGGVYLMPVLQGYAPADYVRHIRMYGHRLGIGLGSGSDPSASAMATCRRSKTSWPRSPPSAQIFGCTDSASSRRRSDPA
jgi:hypothetical protein